MIRKLRTITLVLLLSSLFPFPAIAQQITLDELLPPMSDSQRGSLLSEGQVLHFHPEGVSPELLPATTLSSTVRDRILSGNLNIGIEGLFFTSIEKLPDGFLGMPSSKRLLLLYNILRSVSTLQGLEYYSATRKQMRLLFAKSWVIANPKSKDPLPDPLLTGIPRESRIYMYQKDMSFGSNKTEITYRATAEALAADMVNLTPLRYKGIFKVVNKKDMQIHLIVIPVREGLLLYGAMSARTRDVKSFIDRAQNSFTNRVIALNGWYQEQLIEKFTE